MWRPGESGNPNGRPKGARNKRNEEFFSQLEERGDKDPAELLSEIVSDNNEQKEYRIQAAGLLLPYKYAKLGSRPKEHAYNDPTLSPLAFLQAVARDPTVPLPLRIQAAEAAMPYVAAPLGLRWEDRAPEDRLTIRICSEDYIPNNVHVSFTLPGKSPFSVEADEPSDPDTLGPMRATSKKPAIY